MRARLSGVRSLTAAGGTSLLLLVTACGGPAAKKNDSLGGPEASASTTTTTAPATSSSPGAPGTKPAPGKSGAPKASATSAVQGGGTGSGTTSGGGTTGTTGGTTGTKTGASPTPRSQQTYSAMSFNTKCRKPADSVDTGVALKGQKPPAFKATRLDCQAFDFASYTQGKPTLVTFFASWCEPCHKEAKDIEALYEEHRDAGFTVVGVETQDENGSPSFFYNTAKWSFPAVWDDKEKIEKAWNTSGGLSTLPGSFWIHPDGTISSISVGEMSRSQMEDEYKKL